MIPTSPSEWLAELRRIAAGGGIGGVAVNTAKAGQIFVWFEDINSRPDDADLMAFIQKRCKQEQDQTTQET